MSNKTQLQNNNTTLENLITALERKSAGGGSSGGELQWVEDAIIFDVASFLDGETMFTVDELSFTPKFVFILPEGSASATSNRKTQWACSLGGEDYDDYVSVVYSEGLSLANKLYGGSIAIIPNGFSVKCIAPTSTAVENPEPLYVNSSYYYIAIG